MKSAKEIGEEFHQLTADENVAFDAAIVCQTVMQWEGNDCQRGPRSNREAIGANDG
jgi:hypothetical protein